MNWSTRPSSQDKLELRRERLPDKEIRSTTLAIALYEQRSSIMKTLSIIGITSAAAAMAALGLAPVAAAVPTGGSPADDTVDWLRENGYHVQLNGKPNGPLSQCIATDLHGMRSSNVGPHGHQRDPAQMTTVYVDISCNNTA
jgi:hypothetical protein